VAVSPDGVGPVVVPGANHITVIVDRDHAARVGDQIRRFLDDRFQVM
jgi:hypothetical protein